MRTRPTRGQLVVKVPLFYLQRSRKTGCKVCRWLANASPTLRKKDICCNTQVCARTRVCVCVYSPALFFFPHSPPKNDISDPMVSAAPPSFPPKETQRFTSHLCEIYDSFQKRNKDLTASFSSFFLVFCSCCGVTNSPGNSSGLCRVCEG